MKPNAIFLCESTHNVDYVYSPEQRRQIAERVNLRSGIFNRASLETEDFSDVELIFSTWGMPALTDFQYFPHYGINETLITYSATLKKPSDLYTTGKASKIPNPSQKFLIADTYNCTGTSVDAIDRERGFWRFGVNLGNNYGVPAPRHIQQVGMLYLDGHAGWVTPDSRYNPLEAYPFKWTDRRSMEHICAGGYIW